jgi:hypothetical protein
MKLTRCLRVMAAQMPLAGSAVPRFAQRLSSVSVASGTIGTVFGTFK